MNFNALPKDGNGPFIKDKLLAVNSMQKKAGWAADDIPAVVRNGDWIYQSFTPDGKVNDKANLTACFQCHLPFARDDYQHGELTPGVRDCRHDRFN